MKKLVSKTSAKVLSKAEQLKIAGGALYYVYFCSATSEFYGTLNICQSKCGLTPCKSFAFANPKDNPM